MTTNTLTSWAEVRAKYSATFGNPPQPMDDNDIAAVFREHPLDVITELERIAKSFTAGKLHSPWRALASKLDRISGDHDHVDITRDIRIRQAEAWIRNAGVYCLDESEVVDELFNSQGLLAGLEPEFRTRMLALWRTEKPRGERSVLEATERGDRWRKQHDAMLEREA